MEDDDEEEQLLQQQQQSSEDDSEDEEVLLAVAVTLEGDGDEKSGSCMMSGNGSVGWGPTS